jgi:hypothetical protein
MTRRGEIEKASICQYQIIGTIGEQEAFKNGFVKGAELTDVWGTTGDCTVLIEVKTSRSDFLADKRKYARSKVAEELNHQIGNYRYYLCPEGVITEADLPDNWGLLVYDGKKIHKARMATKVESSLAMELMHITSVMSRILRPQIFNFRENVELKLIEK